MTDRGITFYDISARVVLRINAFVRYLKTRLWLCGFGTERERSKFLLYPSEHFWIRLGFDFAWRCAGTLGALLVRACGTFCLLQGEHVLALVARVIGVLLTEGIVRVAVRVLARLRSMIRLVSEEEIKS